MKKVYCLFYIYDGFEFTKDLQFIYDDEHKAKEKCDAHNSGIKSKYSHYEVEEWEIME